jgi:hypothetical protein
MRTVDDIRTCRRWRKKCSQHDVSLSKGSTRHGAHAVVQLVEALRNKPEGRGFGSGWYHWNFDIILPPALWHWG